MVYRDWNRWNDEGFTFLGSDVSTSWVYLLSQMLFWQLMYLHCLDIHCCRCYFLDQCICKTWYSLLQMLFSLPVMYNCIYILSFLGFKDTSFANLASTSHVFDNVRMLPSKIPHPQSALSTPCRYLPQKFCILSLPFLHLADTPNWIFASSLPENPLSQISPLFFELHDLSRYITYKKIDIRNSSEYGVSVGDT